MKCLKKIITPNVLVLLVLIEVSGQFRDAKQLFYEMPGKDYDKIESFFGLI